MSRNAFSAFFALGLGLAVFVSATRYSIDDSPGLGRRFDGIGGISGGGATSRLLVNYPEPQRSEILDYLFKPNFGASLHILKVEIGGDSQTSDGTEASHMHNEWDENYSRGYEWWLMVEAKRRNPDILLYGLPWAFPGWIGAGSSNPYTNVTRTADYIVRWAKGAKSYYNLTIDFLGIWNEKSYSVEYILTLRKLLDAADLQNTKIVASDNKWDIVNDIIENSSLASAVDYIGVHYPGTVSPQGAVKTGKPLWSSEDYSTFNDIIGAGCLARILNQNYVNGLMTSTLSWNLIAAYYNALPFPRTSLMTAEQPWSGHYVVNYPIWITAHTTQFTRPGWQYLRHDSGVGKLANGGSYVSFTDGSGALTIVLETLSHDNSVCIRPSLPPFSVAEQNVTFTLGGNFSSLEQLNVSYTKLAGDNNRSTVFQQMKPFPVKNGTVTFVVGVNEVYTLTTQPAGTKGTSPQPPPPKPFPLPYEDAFESYQQNGEPNNFAQQVGSFEVVKSADSNRSNVLRQVVLEDPIDWCPGINLAFPLNLIGSDQWTDILVEVDVRIGDVNGTDSVFVASRVDQGGCEAFGAKGFYFFLFPKEQKYELSNDLSRTMCIKTGPALVNSRWTRLGIRTENVTVSGFLNGQLLFSVNSSGVPSHGFAGIGAGSFGIVDFDNFHVSDVNTIEANGANTPDRKEDVLYFIPGLLEP